MGTAECMAAKLRSIPPSQQGTPCVHCNTTALACQFSFIMTDLRCCRSCDERGAANTHVVVSDGT